jgi:hypothetical protein
VIFTIGVVQLPAHWYIEGHAAHSGHRAAADYRRLSVGLRVCKRRHMTIKGQKLVLPSWKFAVLQMAVSSANWMAMGAIIWLLIGEDVNYFFVLGVLLVSSIAGVIVHIPAGIGVLEAVFIALLAGEHVLRERLSPPCWRTACSITSCRWRWQRSVIWCWRVGRKSYARRMRSWRRNKSGGGFAFTVRFRARRSRHPAKQP